MKQLFDVYLTNKENTARFYLGTKGKRPLVFLGLNPSTANQEKSDRTITKVKTFAKNFGYDSFIMINLYSIRNTDPNKLPLKLDSVMHTENIKQIKKLLKKYKRPDLVACWGTKINLREYLTLCSQDIFKSIRPQIGNIYRLGELTENGYPRHPSRIGYNLKLTIHEVSSYLNNYS